MAVETNIKRAVRELTYDDTLVQGDTVDVRAVNPEDGDVSTRNNLKNDGKFIWTWPGDFVGSSEFTVTGSDGGEDTGTIYIG